MWWWGFFLANLDWLEIATYKCLFLINIICIIWILLICALMAFQLHLIVRNRYVYIILRRVVKASRLSKLVFTQLVVCLDVIWLVSNFKLIQFYRYSRRIKDFVSQDQCRTLKDTFYCSIWFTFIDGELFLKMGFSIFLLEQLRSMNSR